MVVLSAETPVRCGNNLWVILQAERRALVLSRGAYTPARKHRTLYHAAKIIKPGTRAARRGRDPRHYISSPLSEIRKNPSTYAESGREEPPAPEEETAGASTPRFVSPPPTGIPASGAGI